MYVQHKLGKFIGKLCLCRQTQIELWMDLDETLWMSWVVLGWQQEAH